MTISAGAGAIGAQGISSATDMISGYFNNKWTKGNSAANTKRDLLLWQAQMNWEREKAQNAYQWAVKDMEKAGLNPILAAGGGGAQTGSATAPKMSGTSPQMSSALRIGNVAETYATLKQQENSDEITAAQVAKTHAETEAINAKNPYIPAQEKAETARKTAEASKSATDAKFANDNYDNRMKREIGEAEKAIADGRLGYENIKFLNKWGITREEAFKIGEAGINLIGKAISGGATLAMVKKIKDQLIQSNKLSAHSAKQMYTPLPRY
jgi:hypothetical protein